MSAAAKRDCERRRLFVSASRRTLDQRVRLAVPVIAFFSNAVGVAYRVFDGARFDASDTAATNDDRRGRVFAAAFYQLASSSPSPSSPYDGKRGDGSRRTSTIAGAGAGAGANSYFAFASAAFVVHLVVFVVLVAVVFSSGGRRHISVAALDLVAASRADQRDIARAAIGSAAVADADAVSVAVAAGSSIQSRGVAADTVGLFRHAVVQEYGQFQHRQRQQYRGRSRSQQLRYAFFSSHYYHNCQ